MEHIVFRIAQLHFYCFYLILKKVGKLLQSVVISLEVGIDLVETMCSTELNTLQRFPFVFWFI